MQAAETLAGIIAANLAHVRMAKLLRHTGKIDAIGYQALRHAHLSDFEDVLQSALLPPSQRQGVEDLRLRIELAWED